MNRSVRLLPRSEVLRLGGGALLALMLCLLAGPALLSARAQDKETVEFRSQILPSPVSTHVGSKASRAVLREFLKDNPNYRIKPFSMPAVQGGTMDTGPLMAIAAGIPPNAIYVNFRQSSTYINHGFLAPLEELLARVNSSNPRVRQTDGDGNWVEDPTPEEIQAALQRIKDRIPGPVWPVVYREASDPRVQEGEHVWALPTRLIAHALLYRKDLFREAGLDPDEPPEDWDELLTYARKLTRPEKRQSGMRIYAGPVMSYGMYNLFAAKGVRAMGRDEEGNWEAAFNTPEAAEAIHFLWRLVNGKFERDGEEIDGAAYLQVGPSRKWDNGEIGMTFTGLSQDLLMRSNPELVGMAPVPSAPDGQKGNLINAAMVGVFSGSTPAQKLGVMKYIWYSISDEAKRISTRVYVENGYGRFVNPTLLRKFGYEHLLTQTSRGWEKSFNAAVQRGVPEPYGRNTQFIYRYMSRPIHEALELPLEQMPREEALKKIEELLDHAAREVNQKLLGTLPAKEMRKRRLVGGVAMLMVVILFVVAMGWVWKSFSEAQREAREKVPLWRYVWGYVLLVPALILIFTWHYLPVLGGAALSFFDFELAIDSEFVGVTNYAQGLYDGVAWRSFGHTIYYVALTLGLGFWPPILVAILLDEVPTSGLKYTFRTIFYLPAIISGVVMLFLWRQLYDPSPNGILNQLITSVNGLGPVASTGVKWILLALWLSLIGFLFSIVVRMKELSGLIRGIVAFVALVLVGLTVWPLVSAYVGPGEMAAKMAGADVAPSGFAGVWHTLSLLVGEFHVEPLRWLKSPKLAMLCVIIPSVWATSGPGCIIYLAALKTVPMELYEAADIDGAGIIHKICYITLPRIKFLIIIQFIAAAVGAFKGGTNFILALTGGGPNGATRLLSLYIFERAYLNLDFGFAAALAWLLGGLLILLTGFQLKRLARARFTSAATSE